MILCCYFPMTSLRAQRSNPCSISAAGLLRLSARNDGVDGPCSTASKCHKVVVVENATERRPSMVEVSTIGLDIAKGMFQVHGVDPSGQVVLARQVRRSAVLQLFRRLPSCLVGLEACASAHYWGREI